VRWIALYWIATQFRLKALLVLARHSSLRATIMSQRSFTLPAIGCLFVAALSACSETASTPENKPQLSALPSQSETPPLASGRDTILWGGLNGGAGDRVFFALDSSLLNPEAMRTLQAQAAFLKANSVRYLTIEGHADERGTREYNLALGDRRANAVRDFLIAQGIPPDRLRTLSYGKERPQVAGHDEAAWSQNRRGVSVLQ
jgi:peptidoglycan-associated lipoprotein